MSINKELYLTLIGAKIRYYRKISQLSQEELAKRVSISQSISLPTLMDIAEGLHVDIQDLLIVSDLEKKLTGWK